MLRSQVIVLSMEASRARSTSWCSVSIWRRAILCYGQIQRKRLSYMQFCVRASREHLSYFDEELFQLVGSRLSTKCWGGTWMKSPVTVLSSCFPGQVGGGSESRDPPHASTRRWSESRGRQAPETPLRDGGPRVSPPGRTVSTARYCYCTATKNSHVRVCGPRMHTHTTKHKHAQCQALTPPPPTHHHHHLHQPQAPFCSRLTSCPGVLASCTWHWRLMEVDGVVGGGTGGCGCTDVTSSCLSECPSCSDAPLVRQGAR